MCGFGLLIAGMLTLLLVAAVSLVATFRTFTQTITPSATLSTPYGNGRGANGQLALRKQFSAVVPTLQENSQCGVKATAVLKLSRSNAYPQRGDARLLFSLFCFAFPVSTQQKDGHNSLEPTPQSYGIAYQILGGSQEGYQPFVCCPANWALPYWRTS